jgi:hypothetical protein
VYPVNFTSKIEDIAIAKPNESLRVGEKLVYSIEWLGLPVGKIILDVEGIAKIDNRECYHIVARAIPNKVISKIYDIEYTVHSYIDTQTFLPQRFEKTRRLNKEINRVVVDFDHKDKTVKYKSEGNGHSIKISPLRHKLETTVPTTFVILDKTQDLLSSFYYFRLQKVEIGKTYPINIYYSQRNWMVDMKVEKVYTREIRKIGAFRVFQVYLESPLGDFILGKRRFSVSFTADSQRIPLEFKLSTGLGPVQGIIQNIQNLSE